jgi:hypothetical protein
MRARSIYLIENFHAERQAGNVMLTSAAGNENLPARPASMSTSPPRYGGKGATVDALQIA